MWTLAAEARVRDFVSVETTNHYGPLMEDSEEEAQVFPGHA